MACTRPLGKVIRAGMLPVPIRTATADLLRDRPKLQVATGELTVPRTDPRAVVDAGKYPDDARRWMGFHVDNNDTEPGHVNTRQTQVARRILAGGDGLMSGWKRVAAWTSVILGGIAAVGLGVYFVASGLDRADLRRRASTSSITTISTMATGTETTPHARPPSVARQSLSEPSHSVAA